MPKRPAPSKQIIRNFFSSRVILRPRARRNKLDNILSITPQCSQSRKSNCITKDRLKLERYMIGYYNINALRARKLFTKLYEKGQKFTIPRKRLKLNKKRIKINKQKRQKRKIFNIEKVVRKPKQRTITTEEFKNIGIVKLANGIVNNLYDIPTISQLEQWAKEYNSDKVLELINYLDKGNGFKVGKGIYPHEIAEDIRQKIINSVTPEIAKTQNVDLIKETVINPQVNSVDEKTVMVDKNDNAKVESESNEVKLSQVMAQMQTEKKLINDFLQGKNDDAFRNFEVVPRLKKLKDISAEEIAIPKPKPKRITPVLINKPVIENGGVTNLQGVNTDIENEKIGLNAIFPEMKSDRERVGGIIKNIITRTMNESWLSRVHNLKDKGSCEKYGGIWMPNQDHFDKITGELLYKKDVCRLPARDEDLKYVGEEKPTDCPQRVIKKIIRGKNWKRVYYYCQKPIYQKKYGRKVLTNPYDPKIWENDPEYKYKSKPILKRIGFRKKR
jgi:hypothetical protein